MGEEKSKKSKMIVRIILRTVIILAEIAMIPVSAAIGVSIDTGMVDPNALGHPVPVFTVIFPMLMIVILMITILIMIVISIVRMVRNRK